MLTIRTKLTLWYTSLIGIILIVSAAFLYFAVNKAMTGAVDAKLIFLAETMAKTVVKPKTHLALPENFDIIMERFFGLKTSGNYIQILDEFGSVKSKSSVLSGFRIPLSGKALQNASENKPSYETVDYVGRQPLRVITYPVMDNNRLKYIIQAGASMEPVMDALNNISFIFYFIIPATMMAATVIGMILASKALYPVTEMTAAARRIEAENLHERIAVSGAGDEIDELAETFNDMIARLESSFNRMRQFTSDASHELRTPLTILKGETEVALKTCNNADCLKDALNSNLEEINRMSNIVNELLFLAEYDMKGRVNFEEVNLSGIIEEKYRQAKHIADEKGIDIKLERNDEITLKGNPLHLRRLVLNLIENAVKYTPETGSVAISLERQGENAVIKISDTGIGIQEEDIPHIFDRFYRMDKSRTGTTGGTGLGLSICKEIAENHSGTIEVKSALGKGSSFIVYIPIK